MASILALPALADTHYVPITKVNQLRSGNKYQIEAYNTDSDNRYFTLNSNHALQHLTTALIESTDSAFTYAGNTEWLFTEDATMSCNNTTNDHTNHSPIFALSNGEYYIQTAEGNKTCTPSTTYEADTYAFNRWEFFQFPRVPSSGDALSVYFGIHNSRAASNRAFLRRSTCVNGSSGLMGYGTNDAQGGLSANGATTATGFSYFFRLYMAVNDLDDNLENSVKYHTHQVHSTDDITNGDLVFLVLNRENMTSNPVTTFNEQKMLYMDPDSKEETLVQMSAVTSPINALWTVTKSGTNYHFSQDGNYMTYYTNDVTSGATTSTGTTFTVHPYEAGGRDVFFLKYSNIAWSFNSTGQFGNLTGSTTSIYNDYCGLMRIYIYDPAAFYGDCYYNSLMDKIDEAHALLGTDGSNGVIEESSEIAGWLTEIDEFCAKQFDSQQAVDEAYQTLYNKISTRLAETSFATEALDEIWGGYDNQTVLLKNKRSSYYVAVNPDDNKLMAYATADKKSLWTLKKVANGGNKFKLYNPATGRYMMYASGTTGNVSPLTADSEDNASVFAFDTYTSSNYVGYISLRYTGLESGSNCLHQSQYDTNGTITPYNQVMFYDATEAGSQFAIKFIDEEFINPLLTDLTDVGDIAVETIDNSKLSQVSSTALKSVNDAINNAKSTSSDDVIALWGAYETLRDSRQGNYPVYRVVWGDDEAYSLTSGTSFAYSLTDPLDKNQYWRIAKLDPTIEAGTYTIGNYSSGNNLFGATTITVGDEAGTITPSTFSNRQGWSLIYIGTTAELAEAATTLDSYTAGNLPKARFISRHLGSNIGEYAADDVENIKQVAENFQSYTATPAAYAEHSDDAATAASTLLTATLNMPQTGTYLRMKATPKRAINGLNGVQCYLSSNIVSSKASSVSDATTGDNEETTLFYYAPYGSEDGNALLISYATGGYATANAASSAKLTFGTTAEENATALSTNYSNVGYQIAQSEDGAYIFRFQFDGTSLDSGRCPSINAAGSGTDAGAGDASALASSIWSGISVEAAESLPVTIESDNLASIQVPVALQIPTGTDASFYVVKQDGDKLILHQAAAGETYAANTAIIVGGESGTKVHLPIVDGNAEGVNSEYQGTTANQALTTYTPTEGKVLFAKTILSTDNDAAAAPAIRKISAADSSVSVNFAKLESGATIPVNTMLTEFSSTSQAANESTISVELPDDSTSDVTYDAANNETVGINAIVVERFDGTVEVYDLQGRRVNAADGMRRGIYIVNGRKVAM
jgi:hypothetical protein